MPISVGVSSTTEMSRKISVLFVNIRRGTSLLQVYKIEVVLGIDIHSQGKQAIKEAVAQPLVIAAASTAAARAVVHRRSSSSTWTTARAASSALSTWLMAL